MQAAEGKRSLGADELGGRGPDEAARPPAMHGGELPALTRIARGVFAIFGALPWLIPIARSRLPLGEFGVALDQIFLPMCHRLPERSLSLGGVQMPLCSRCAGIFAGLAAGAIVARPALPMSVWRPALVAAAGLMTLDVLTQDLGLHPVWHPARLATGILLGYCMAVAFVTNLSRRPS